ncbi:MAG: hypothetical protein P9M14_18040 [Candidatus Alcyoniella australis]|nr:hypothetical protein [Candidatus Alcyoniella australis]
MHLTLWPFKHNGRTFRPGDTVEDLPEAVAARLLELGAIERQQPAKAAEPDVADIARAIRDAIETGQTTKDGKPTVEALEERLGVAVSAKQRDEWFQGYQEISEK